MQRATTYVLATCLLTSCGNPATGSSTDSDDNGSAHAEQASARISSPLDTAFSAAATEFYGSGGAAPAAGNPLARMREDGETRLLACANPACRQDVEADLLNRLRFANGEASDPVPGIPWRTGLFRFKGEGVSGGLILLPLAGRRILVSISTYEAEQARWMCEEVIAEGELGPDGVARLTTLDGKGIHFSLHPTGPHRIELRPLQEHIEHYRRLCGAGGTIFGRYEAPALRP